MPVSGSRPSSAGTSRGRGSSGFSSGSSNTFRGNTGVTNLYTSAHPQFTPQHFGQNISSNRISSSNQPYGQQHTMQHLFGQQRPSSASHKGRPSSASAQSSGSSRSQNPQQNINLNMGTNIPSNNMFMPGLPMNMNVTPPSNSSSSSSSRPKSAGSIRRNVPTNVPFIAQQFHSQGQSQPQQSQFSFLQQQQQQQYLKQQQQLQQSQVQQQQQLNQNHFPYVNQQYPSQYPSINSNPIQNILQTQQVQSQPQTQTKQPSSASIKLKQALDLSNKLEQEDLAEKIGNITIANATGNNFALPNLNNSDKQGKVEEDAEEDIDTGLETDPKSINKDKVKNSIKNQNDQTNIDDDDQEEMDGKQVSQLRKNQPTNTNNNVSNNNMSNNNPSVSASVSGVTVSESVYLGDSVYNDNRSILTSTTYNSGGNSQPGQAPQPSLGLSTIPNPFCNNNDALELKKLLLLSHSSTRINGSSSSSNNSTSSGNHGVILTSGGGFMPSSSAVMDMYMVGKVIGVGSYGKVRAAWHRLTSMKVAIKTYDKMKFLKSANPEGGNGENAGKAPQQDQQQLLLSSSHWKRVQSEINIMSQLNHPRIARMYEAIETPKRMHLIMECLDGGNLCTYVKNKKKLSEEESKLIFYQIMQGLLYIHNMSVTHRDIKLENILFVGKADGEVGGLTSYNGYHHDIKLIDFGFSTVCQPGKKLKVFCGTPSYMAPEIVKRTEYEGKPVDMWSMGILLYALLCGCFPFRAKTYPDLYRRIARGAFQMPEEFSPSLKDLLKSLLTVDVDSRITAPMVMKHPWLQNVSQMTPTIEKLKQEMSMLISDKPSDDLDDEVLREHASFGIPKDEIIRLVVTKTHSSLTTLYYLLLEYKINKRKKQHKNGTGNKGNYNNKFIVPYSVTTTFSSTNFTQATSGASNSYTDSTQGSFSINQLKSSNISAKYGQENDPNNPNMDPNSDTNSNKSRPIIQSSPMTSNNGQLSGSGVPNYELGYQNRFNPYQQQTGTYINFDSSSKQRPRSASATRGGSNSMQRPLSAFSGRKNPTKYN